MTITPIISSGSARVTTRKRFFGGVSLASATLTVPVRIEHDGNEEVTEIILPDICFKNSDLRSICGRTFTFPVNPGESYIDGSVYYGEVHNPVDCDVIRVLSAMDASVTLRLHFVIDFSYEGLEEHGKREETMTVHLPVIGE